MCYALNWLDCVCFRSHWEPVSDLDGRCWTWSLFDLKTLFVTIHRLAQPMWEVNDLVIHPTKTILTECLFTPTCVEVHICKNYMKKRNHFTRPEALYFNLTCWTFWYFCRIFSAHVISDSPSGGKIIWLSSELSIVNTRHRWWIIFLENIT